MWDLNNYQFQRTNIIEARKTDCDNYDHLEREELELEEFY